MSAEHEWPVEVWADLAKARRADSWNRVVELVRYGKLSPDRAEAWARERGLPSFERRPAPDEHDPMASIDWTLAMATAWIIWRTPQAVRERMEAYVAECSDWTPCDYTRASRRGPPRPYRVRGHELKTPTTPTPRDVLERALIDKAFGSSEVAGPEQAERELREALRMGDLVARGGPQADAIDKHRWIVLSPFTRARHGGPHDAVYGEVGEVQFSRVTVERDTVVSLWKRAPARATGVKPGRPPTKRRAITALMVQDLRSGKITKEDKQEALAARYGASREAVIAALRDAVSETEFPTNADTDQISTA